MNKLSKFASVLIVSSLIISNINFTLKNNQNIIQAKETNEILKFKIGEVFFETTDYDYNKVYIEKEDNILKETVYIKDKETNNILRIISINKNITRSYSAPFQLSQTILSGPINVNVNANFQMYMNGSFREVEYVNSADLSIPWKKAETGYLTNPNASAWKESSTTISVSYNTTVHGGSNGILNREFDNAGYTYTGNGQYYKYINGSTRISLY